MTKLTKVKDTLVVDNPVEVLSIHHIKEKLFQINVKSPPVKTTHKFVEGMYFRECKLLSNTLTISRTHKSHHMFYCLSGDVLVRHQDDSVSHLKAGDSFESFPGDYRLLYALEDTICMTVHRTDSTDVEEVFETLVEPDEDSKYDAFNNIKEQL